MNRNSTKLLHQLSKCHTNFFGRNCYLIWGTRLSNKGPKSSSSHERSSCRWRVDGMF
ncbi:hypothetical protein BRADI_2g27055v3 [Brachypodium distachyon]|uniref:Uncharacterized protein n=1 Tax=Brachypodium distachyon TaxID=15368 RepID=A0A2K2DAW2_BRADI|nr:hypothetical protein BRADI_2g27055v3 [Brachypodium distachyon]